MDKQALRKTYIAKRNALSSSDVLNFSKEVLNHLTPLVKHAKTVSLFYPLGNEVNLLSLYDEARHVLCFPKVTNVGLHFYPIEDLSDLVPSVFGLKEPLYKHTPIDKSWIDIVLVPGLVFGKNGHRIGYGKGYYDSFLSDFKGLKIGVCFDFQLLDYLDSESHDVALDYIVTNKGVFQCAH